jgi:sugar/nucleoside kinase (ribokinase family)
VVAAPAFPIENVVDPTGAGDSFAGGFMGHIAEKGNVLPTTLRQAMLYGTVTASWCVQGFGVEALAGRGRREIDTRYDELRTICTV